MPGQNIKNYYFNRFDARLSQKDNFDITLSSDYDGYDSEVVFSTKLIGENNGNILPVNIDLNSVFSNQKLDLSWGEFNVNNTILSKNYYNPNNEDLSCKTATTLCDIGLTAIDNGLYSEMTGQTITFTMGVNDYINYNPHYYDRRLKLHPVTGYTSSPNHRFSGNTKETVYNIISKNDNQVGYYNELYGGFYQGFYKLSGYDYEVLPERFNKGWTTEFLLKPRKTDEYNIDNNQIYLNDIYPDNSGTFFFMGTRAENKFYHPASGSPVNDSGYTRVTSGLTECIKTCACSDTGVTNSECILVYPQTATTQVHRTGSCGVNTEKVPKNLNPPDEDLFSNALSFRLSGDPENPKVCVKYIKFTGDCVTTGTCENTGVTYTSGYTIVETCSSKGIYDDCSYDLCSSGTSEQWVMISAVFSRYETLEDCDLLNVGGLGDVRKLLYPSEINGASYNIIMPPQTHSGSTKEVLQNIIEPNRKWFENYLDRLGNLYIYVNGYRFMTIENFEEIIPHELNTEKEKQLGVPFNISLGGGTQGLRESLVFSGCSGLTGPYIQDPELMPNQTLSGTSLSGLTTDIVMEPNFGGTFMGAISQFRMYVEPLSAPQIQHNFRLLKDRFSLFDFWCPECESCLVTPTPTPSITPTISVTPSVSISSSLTPTPTTTPTITPSNTQTPTPTPTNTSFSCNLVVSGRIDTSLTPTPTTTPTPTPQPNCELIIISSVSNINDYTLDMGVSYNSGSTIATYTFTASTNLPQTTIIDFTNEIYKNDGTSILINSSVTINKNERIGSNVVVISDLDYSDIRPYELSYSGVSSIGVDFNVINKTSRVYYDRVDTPLWVQYIFRDCCGLLDDIIGFVSESALNTWILNGFGVEYDRNCYVPSRLNTEPGPVVGYFYGPDFKTCDKKPKTCLPCPQPTPTPTPTRTTIGYTAKQMCCQNLCTYESDIPNTGGICDDNQSEYVIRRLTGPVNMINKYVYYDLPYGLSSCYKITDIEPYPPQLYEEYTSGLFPIYSGDFYDTCEECFENNPTNVPCVMGYRWAIFKSCCKEPLENEGIINNDFLGEEYVGYYVVMAKVSENLALFLDERLSYTEPASDYQSLFNGLTTLSKVHPNYIPAQEMGNVFSNGTQGDVEFYTRCIKFQEFVSEEYVNNFTDGLNGLNINSNYLFVSNNYPICTFNYGFNYWGLDPFFYSCCTCECNPMYLDLQQQTEEYINVVGLNCCEYTYQWFTIPVPSDTVIEVGMIFTNNTVYSNNLCWFVYSVEPEVPFRFPNIGSLTPYTSCDECCSGPSQIESNCTCEP